MIAICDAGELVLPNPRIEPRTVCMLGSTGLHLKSLRVEAIMLLASLKTTTKIPQNMFIRLSWEVRIMKES